MERWQLSILFMALPFLLGAYCNLQTRLEQVLAQKTVPPAAAEEVIADFLKIKPFVTLTPTATPTLTPTATSLVKFLPGDDLFTATPGVNASSTDGQTPSPSNQPDNQPSPTPVSALVTPTPTLPQPLATPSPTSTVTPIPTLPTPTVPPPTSPPPTNTPVPPVIAFSIGNISINETGITATLTVVLNKASAQIVTVHYATGGGTATPGSDYVPISGTLTFNPGQTSRPINIIIIDNIIPEANETFFITLSAPVNANLGLPNPARVTVLDNDMVVNTTTDTDDGTCDASHCSLREAINKANALPGANSISFNIPGAGAHTISLVTPLPSITDPVLIDAASQPLANCLVWPPTLRIALNGSSTITTGLHITAGTSWVRGLAINGFNIGVELSNNGTNLLTCNYIGTDINGAAAPGNSIGIFINNTPGNIIGGGLGSGNLISDNTNSGVDIEGNAATNNRIQGNYIGTTADGLSPLSNLEGVTIVDAPANLIGGTTGTTPGGTCTGDCNVISGNSQLGIYINGMAATGNIVQGNRIGTDSGGLNPVSNLVGVVIQDAPGNTIGGGVAGARNLISGNGGDGIDILGAGSTGNMVQGNYIGTDVSGNVALSNANGIIITGAPTNTIVSNLISGHPSSGIIINLPDSTGNIVRGNYIGTNAAGTAAIGNSIGVFIQQASNNLIGGPGGRNLISGNSGDGVLLAATAAGNRVQGNYIGTDISGTAPLGNTTFGVHIVNASGNVIGGNFPGAPNVIAYNGSDGVQIEQVAVNNPVQGNAVFTNTGLGINLGTDMVTANDTGDPDTGPNNLQNYPVLTSVASSGAAITITGIIDSAPAAYRIEFFTNDACDPSGYGEGQRFLDATNVMTGTTTFTAIFMAAVPAGQFITATATDPNNNTSEFSACLLVP